MTHHYCTTLYPLHHTPPTAPLHQQHHTPPTAPHSTHSTTHSIHSTILGPTATSGAKAKIYTVSTKFYAIDNTNISHRYITIRHHKHHKLSKSLCFALVGVFLLVWVFHRYTCTGTANSTQKIKNFDVWWHDLTFSACLPQHCWQVEPRLSKKLVQTLSQCNVRVWG